jgi:hypothetical protein
MKILYQDEYANNIHEQDVDTVPRIGDSVMFVNEDWHVKAVTWMIERDAVIVELSQNIIRESKDTSPYEIIEDLKRTVSSVVQTQQAQDKKTRQLREQIATLRQGINQRIYNERKT